MSLTLDGIWKAGVWNSSVWTAGVWYEAPPPAPPSDIPPPFYRLIRKKKKISPRRDLEAFAFRDKTPKELKTPAIELDIEVDPILPREQNDALSSDIEAVSKAIGARVVSIQEKIIARMYDDDEDLLGFL